MASSGGCRMVKSVCDYCGRNHGGECRERLRVCFGGGSRDYMAKDCPFKIEVSTEQSIRSPQKIQHETRSRMAAKSGSV